MPSQYELFEQMKQMLNTLVENAKALKAKAQERRPEKELEPLQQRQHEILHELTMLDALVSKSPPGADEKALEEKRLSLQKLLEEFQHVNEEFIRLIADQFRLIQEKDLGMDAKKMLNE